MLQAVTSLTAGQNTCKLPPSLHALNMCMCMCVCVLVCEYVCFKQSLSLTAGQNTWSFSQAHVKVFGQQTHLHDCLALEAVVKICGKHWNSADETGTASESVVPALLFSALMPSPLMMACNFSFSSSCGAEFWFSVVGLVVLLVGSDGCVGFMRLTVSGKASGNTCPQIHVFGETVSVNMHGSCACACACVLLWCFFSRSIYAAIIYHHVVHVQYFMKSTHARENNRPVA